MTEPVDMGTSAAPTSGPAAAPTGRSLADVLWQNLYKYLLVVVLLAVVLIFSILRPQIFPTLNNLASILTGGAPLVLIALAAMLPVIVNQFDLTPGFMATWGGLLCAGLMSFSDWDPLPAIVVAVLVCVLFGLVNGLLVAVLRLSSLIVTLATGIMIFGLAQWYSGGITIFNGIPQTFVAFGQTRLLGYIPLPFIYAFVIATAIWYVLEFRPLGRQLYAIGGSEEGARLLGIPVARRTILVFVGSALLAGFAGVIETSRVGSMNPTGLQPMLLPAFTAVFLGATSIRPGQYNVWGTVLAVYVVRAATTGLFMLGAPTYTGEIFNGAILLIAILLAKLSAHRLTETT
jgi:ribose transport system permease protein